VEPSYAIIRVKLIFLIDPPGVHERDRSMSGDANTGGIVEDVPKSGRDVPKSGWFV
jgi:hypothetical protein